MTASACPLCDEEGGVLVLRRQKYRVVRASEKGIAAFYRLVWNTHVAEFSDLPPQDQVLCMQAVVQVESVLREVLQPHKINLATLGNVVPHLHWHIIARFEGDSHFPAPVWASAQREPDASLLARVQAQLPRVEQLLVQRLV